MRTITAPAARRFPDGRWPRRRPMLSCRLDESSAPPDHGRAMFGPLGAMEIVFILVLALLVFGPRRLPEVGRTVGKALGEFRRATNDLKRSVNAELALEEERPLARRPSAPRVAGTAGAGAATLAAPRPAAGTEPRAPAGGQLGPPTLGEPAASSESGLSERELLDANPWLLDGPADGEPAAAGDSEAPEEADAAAGAPRPAGARAGD